MGKQYGWQGQLLRIDLTSGETQAFSTGELAERFIGGRGFLTKLYWDEVSPETDPFAPESPIYIMTGPLAGTAAPAGSRWLIGGKSPLLYPAQFGLGAVGGSFGVRLKAAGFDGLIITGRARKASYLHLENGTCTVRDADGLWGLDIPATMARLGSAHPQATAVCIGPAGENKVRIALAMSDNGACGGSGCGALMGSKNLKAIVAEGDRPVAVARPDELKRLAGRIRSLIDGRVLMDPNIEGIELVRRTPCAGCPAGCPRGLYRHDSGAEEIRKNCGSAYMYYTWDRLQHDGESTPGAFLATSLVDRLGLCAQEMNNVLHFLHAAGTAGLLTSQRAGIDLSQQGTLDYIEKLVDMIVYRKGFGDVLAEGTARAGRELGAGEVLDRRITPSGFNLHAYNPRFFVTTAPFYATESTSTMNQLHEVAFPVMKWTMWYATDGGMSPFSTGVLQEIARRFWIDERAVDFSTYAGKAAVAALIQNREYAKETLAVCDFMYPLTTSEGAPDNVGDPALESSLLSAVTGLDVSEQDYYRIGERVFNLQRAIQGREGRAGRKDDVVSELYFTEPFEEEPGFFGVFNPELMLPGPGGELITRKGAVLDRQQFTTMMDEYYELRGWDIAGGLQKAATLKDLGLGDILPELRDRGLLSE